MNLFYNTVSLLKRYGRFSWVAWDLILTLVLIALGACINDIETVFFAVLPLTMVAWEISDVYLFEKSDGYKQQLSDKEDEVVLLNGEKSQLQEEVERLGAIIHDRKDNPIKSNRIVSDKTFAVRLRNFAEGTQAIDPATQEELDYFKMTAERLLKWQTKTVHKDSEEYRYLERLGLMPHPSDNTEEYTEGTPKEKKPKKRPASGKKPKTGPQENENKD